MTPAIEVRELGRRFGDVTALDRLDLDDRRRAPCSGCSGPTVPARRRSCASWPRCCAPTTGSARVLGHDVVARAARGPPPRSASQASSPPSMRSSPVARTSR